MCHMRTLRFKVNNKILYRSRSTFVGILFSYVIIGLQSTTTKLLLVAIIDLEYLT